ncbi:MAG TPA: aspartate kinase [Dehalococcoidia bacterium]|nr:aspartate kinase [Dehalococcoidia bacterium]
MALIVRKYGGSSVADAEKIKNVAVQIVKAKDEGDQVVVVVSAMGDSTDELLALAQQVAANPDSRELDALVSTGEIVSATLMTMALHDMGYKAISLTGAQAGIHTTSTYRQARIIQVDTTRVKRELEKDNIIIVAGFQGVTEDMDVTTLGRGASDTSAVALAASLGAKVCERYTDVKGIYTADPRIVPEARPLAEISYEEMLELSQYGSMHSRAIELAQLYNIPILVTSSFVKSPGTLIHGGEFMEVRNKVSSVAYDLDVAKITIVGVPDRPGIAASIFEPLATANISVDTIVQNASVDNITDLTFTVAEGNLGKALEVVRPVCESISARDCVGDAKLGKISIIGTGMQNAPGYASRMFKTLSDEGINIQLITTSEIRITCIVEESKVKDAVRALHKAFELDKND